MTDVDNTERLVALGLSTLVFDRLKNVITKVKSNLLNTSISVVWHVDLESIVDRCAKPSARLSATVWSNVNPTLVQGLYRFLIQI